LKSALAPYNDSLSASVTRSIRHSRNQTRVCYRESLRDGKIWRTGPRLEVLGAWLDAYLAGASSYDADDIANVIERRPRPSYEERRAVFKLTGRPEPSREPFPIVSKGGGRPAF
jgi:hypothetical protein